MQSGNDTILTLILCANVDILTPRGGGRGGEEETEQLVENLL